MRLLPAPTAIRIPTWIRTGLAIAVVGIATALGALLGLVLGPLVRLLWPSVGRTTVEVLLPVCGFNLGWWWYATAGQRWVLVGRGD